MWRGADGTRRGSRNERGRRNGSENGRRRRNNSCNSNSNSQHSSNHNLSSSNSNRRPIHVEAPMVGRVTSEKVRMVGLHMRCVVLRFTCMCSK